MNIEVKRHQPSPASALLALTVPAELETFSKLSAGGQGMGESETT
jgi:hypothetical protein